MAKIDCIITGCTFQDVQGGRSVHGDLHIVEGTWVFNAVLDEHGAASWCYDGDPERERTWRASKQLICEGHFWERRGVIVCGRRGAYLNPEAEAYAANALARCA